MKFFFEYRVYLIILLIVITTAVYWKLGLFRDQSVNGVVKSIPFIVMALLALIPVPDKYQD